MTPFSERIKDQHSRVSMYVKECLSQVRDYLDGADNRELLEALLHREARERQALRALLDETCALGEDFVFDDGSVYCSEEER